MKDLWPQIISYAVSIGGALALFLVAWLAAGKIRTMLIKALSRYKVDVTLSSFLGNIARWVVILMALLACLGIFGVETTSFAALIGAAALAIGLAFQGSLSHVAAGTMLLLFRPFKVGDVVNIGGQLGTVNELGLFTTLLDTPDNRRIILPNGIIFGSTIENITHHPTRRVDVNVGCAYDADIDATRAVLEGALRELPGALAEPAPKIVLVDLGDSSVNWQVRIWSDTVDFLAVREATVRAVKRALDAAQIEIPFPQVSVHMPQPTKPGLSL